MIKKLNESLEEYLLVSLLAVAVFSVALQIFMRYVIGSSLSWSEELARYCFIWLIYIAIAYGVKKGRHITFDTIYDILPDKGKKVIELVATIIFGLFALTMIYYGYKVVMQIASYGQTSPAMGISMVLVYLAAPVGMLLTTFRVAQNIWLIIKNWNKPIVKEELF
ncbi:TRAP transporter small permease [Alkalihalobacillus sp. BA299]|uniref:TRAP transporter small permease n=1 Tax=Alkalihalobacillus sp. BA299 TaxID=2815938 RepID=UPI001AD9CA47|nr:TRAP transporter small permease [Alkalihalobacillus sp. BA299]